MPSKHLSRSLIRANSLLSSSKYPSCTSATSHLSASSPSLISIRHESSWRRQTQRLAMPEAPSMKTRKTKGPPKSHIIFNPPPSMPNVYHTPLKFLPRNDKRRQLYERGPSLYNLPSGDAPASLAAPGLPPSLEMARRVVSPISTPGTALHARSTFPAALAPRLPASASLPPALTEPTYYPRALKQEGVEEIRQLRLADPFVWTRQKLAEKFGCSNYLVGVIQKSKVAGQARALELEAIRKRWGPGRMKAKRDRLRRIEMWRRDA